MDIFKEPVKATMDCSDFITLMSIYGTKMRSYNPDEIIDIKVLDDNNRVVKVKFADGYVVKMSGMKKIHLTSRNVYISLWLKNFIEKSIHMREFFTWQRNLNTKRMLFQS